MRWTPQGKSRNIEDRRGQRPTYRRPAPMGCGGLIFILILSYVFGINPVQMLLSLGDGAGGMGVETLPPPSSGPVTSSADEELMVELNRAGYRGAVSIEWEDNDVEQHAGGKRALANVHLADQPPSGMRRSSAPRGRSRSRSASPRRSTSRR